MTIIARFHCLCRVWTALGLLLLIGCDDEAISTGHLQSKGCDADKAIEVGGQRRLALIIGVGQYRDDRIPDLQGPPNDARRFYDLLTGPNGYGFPAENVCLLLDERATTDRFREAFRDVLVDRAREQDVAVMIFAGHGSQARDRNADEPDAWDETLLFHDARVGDVRDLRDDELNGMLSKLHAKTRHTTIILDACNSGTATRGIGASTTTARFFTPMDDAGGDSDVAESGGDGSESWVPASLPGLVALTAASDGNPALEKDGEGLFSLALIQVLSQVGARPLTYAQVARRVTPLLAAASPQVPHFHGELTGIVFGNAVRSRPVSWEVRQVWPELELSGAPLPGIGPGAELRIFDGDITGAGMRDPAQAKATVVVRKITGLNARAEIIAVNRSAGEISEGDLAVPVRPGDAYLKLRVRIRPADERGGLAADRAEALRRSIAADPDSASLIDLTEGPGDFELSADPADRLVLRGPANRVRVTYERDSAVPRNLWQHARQRALLQLRGEGGSDFVDHETLQVRLLPAPETKQASCAQGEWQQAEPNREQIVPLCHAWNLEVSLTESSPVPLLIGALLLTSDGGVFALPADNQILTLRPGDRHVFNASGETFQGAPPLDVRDSVLVFGTQETNPVPWYLFAEAAATRQATKGGTLYRALDRFMRAGGRNAEPMREGTSEDTTWTMSSLPIRVAGY